VSLDELYREVILDHYRSPRNREALENPTAHADGYNPLCGDEISIDLIIEGDTITDIAVISQGCSISQSSASMMSEKVKGISTRKATPALIRNDLGLF
jgi:nitrogen fixation NifU-like protein